MFTPPPSPLPGSQFQPASSSACSKSADGLLTPPSSPPEKTAFTPPASYACKENENERAKVTEREKPEKRRKRYLPVLLAAVILAVIAVSARPATLQAVSLRMPWSSAPTEPISPPVPSTVEPEVERLELEAEHIHGRRLGRRHEHDELAARQAGTPTSPSSATGSSTSTDPLASASALLPIYTAPPTVPTPALPVPTPFPAPFDISLSFNITTPSCVTFFNTFIQNITFRACRPFGMLLSSSQQFLAAQSNLTTLTSIVGGTCDTDMSADQCGQVMDWHASQITLPENCGTDINTGEALAITALNGFRSYRMMRTAGCLINPVTQAYCYVEAVASLLPDDLYFWITALGTPLPNATKPTCSACTRSLLGVYAQFVGQGGLLGGRTYAAAAGRAREVCGEGYASDVAVPSSALPVGPGILLSSMLALGLSVCALLLQVL